MEDNYFSKRQGVTVFKCLDSSSYLTYFLSNSKYLSYKKTSSFINTPEVSIIPKEKEETT